MVMEVYLVVYYNLTYWKHADVEAPGWSLGELLPFK